MPIIEFTNDRRQRNNFVSANESRVSLQDLAFDMEDSLLKTGQVCVEDGSGDCLAYDGGVFGRYILEMGFQSAMKL